MPWMSQLRIGMRISGVRGGSSITQRMKSEKRRDEFCGHELAGGSLFRITGTGATSARVHRTAIHAQAGRAIGHFAVGLFGSSECVLTDGARSGTGGVAEVPGRFQLVDLSRSAELGFSSTR